MKNARKERSEVIYGLEKCGERERSVGKVKRIQWNGRAMSEYLSKNGMIVPGMIVLNGNKKERGRDE